MNKKYRFFFHYNKVNSNITFHYRGKCYFINDLRINTPLESKFNKIQPKFVMQGFCTEKEFKEWKIN